MLGWFASHAPEGATDDLTGEEFEFHADWRGDPGALWAGFLRSGWLVEVEGGGVRVRSWDEWYGSALNKRRASAERQRRKRDKSRSPETREHSTPQPIVTPPSRVSHSAKEIELKIELQLEKSVETKPSAGARVADAVPDVISEIVPRPPESDLFKPRAVARATVAANHAANPADVVTVTTHYRGHQPDAPEFLPQGREWRAVAARLAEGFSPTQLCEAVDGMHASPFHRGLNSSNTPHLGLELACRSSDKVRSFCAIWRNRDRPAMSARMQQSMVVGAKWATGGAATFAWESAANGA